MSDDEREEEEERPDLVPVQRNQCPHCFAQFTLEKNYVDHMWTAHGSKRPFRCDDCGIFLSYRSSLYNHKKIHSDKRPFACSDCSAKFRWNNSLKYHMARAHQKVAIITAKQVTATAPLPAPVPTTALSRAQANRRKNNISDAIDTVLSRVNEQNTSPKEWEEAGPSEDERSKSESTEPKDVKEEVTEGVDAGGGSAIAQLLMASAYLASETGSRKRKTESRKSSRKAARPRQILQAPEEEPDEAEGSMSGGQSSGRQPSLPELSPSSATVQTNNNNDPQPSPVIALDPGQSVTLLSEIQRQQGSLLSQMEAFEGWMRLQFEQLNASLALLVAPPPNGLPP